MLARKAAKQQQQQQRIKVITTLTNRDRRKVRN
jgi:hypothetical protein